MSDAALQAAQIALLEARVVELESSRLSSSSADVWWLVSNGLVVRAAESRMEIFVCAGLTCSPLTMAFRFFLCSVASACWRPAP